MDKFSFTGWVKGKRSSRKIPTSIVTSAMDPSSVVLQVLTIDLIHDWCQRGTISRLVFEHDQWHALIVGSPWREKRLRWQEPIVTIYDSTSNSASLHNCSLAFVSGCCYTCFPGILSCFAICPYFKCTHPNSLFFLSALKKQQHSKNVMQLNENMRSRIRKAINTFLNNLRQYLTYFLPLYLFTQS